MKRKISLKAYLNAMATIKAYKDREYEEALLIVENYTKQETPKKKVLPTEFVLKYLSYGTQWKLNNSYISRDLKYWDNLTFEELSKIGESKLMKVRGIGRVTITEIRNTLFLADLILED